MYALYSNSRKGVGPDGPVDRDVIYRRARLRIIGIDPGQKGALVSLDLKTGGVIDMIVMPEHPQELVKYLEDVSIYEGASNVRVYLEQAQVFPKNGSVSMFKYGRSFGHIEGILMSLHIVYELVPPREWTKVMHVGTVGIDPKAKSLQVAYRLYPSHALTTPGSERAKKPHDGIVDALLIAVYGCRNIK